MIGSRTLLAVAIGIVLLCLTACGPFVDPYNLQDQADQPAGVLGAGTSVGQTFVSHCDGLTAVDVRVAVYPGMARTAGSLILTLWSTAKSADSEPKPLATQRVAETALAPNEWIRFSFAPMSRSRGQTYLVRIGSTDQGRSPVTVWATGHLMATGSLRSVGAASVPGTLVYRAFCDQSPGEVAVETLSTVERSGWLWPIALLLCVVPGLGIATLLTRRDEDPAAFAGLAIGWSVLLAPIGLALATPARLGAPMGLVLVAMSAALVIWRRPILRLTPWAVLAFGATAVALVIRAVDAKGLVAPMWGDPVQHSYVTALILGAGGVPSTYGSLVPSQVFDYHFGFQTLAAYASWLSGANVADSVLATGQLLDALIPLSIYRFGRDLVGSPHAGAVAAVLVAMVTTQPTYFVTWGRYPELAALVALPAAAAALRAALGCRSVAPVLIAAVAAGAMVVVHPRVAIFLASLGIAFILADSLEKRQIRAVWPRLTRLVAIGCLGLLLIAPWVVRLWTAHHHQVVQSFDWQPISFPVDLATAGNDRWVLVLALVGLVVGLYRRPALSALFAGWSCLVFVIANPATFHIPFYVFLDPGSVAIALFLPASVLVGSLFDTLAATCHLAEWPRGFRWSTAGLLFLAGLSQAPALTTVVNPCCMLIRPGDLAAIDWVSRNTPPDARFLINGYPWSGPIWMGSDAGYWLPVLAHRRTSLPPLFYAVGPADEVNQVNDVAASVRHDAVNPAALAALARRIGAEYVFIGTRGGDLDPSLLSKSGYFRVIYGGGVGSGGGDPGGRSSGVEAGDAGAWVLELTATGLTLSSSTDTGMTPSANAPPRSSNADGLRSSTSG